MIMIEKINVGDNFSIPDETVFRKQPSNLKETDSFLFNSEYKKNLPSVTLKKICYGAVLPSGQLLNGFLLERNQFNINLNLISWVKSYIKCFISLFRVRSLKRLDNAFYVTNANSKNFFHWFLDVSQKIEFLERKSSYVEKSVSVIIPNDHEEEYVEYTLRAFGCSFYRQSKYELLVGKCLLSLPNVAPTGNYRKDIVVSLREKLIGAWCKGHPAASRTTRLYVTRRNAGKRKIINEKRLLPILERKGFDIVDFDELSFEEQLQHSLVCEVLVSLHGAALTHMLWINGPAKVLEIRARDDSHNNCYFSLASDLGHEYYYALADKVDVTATTQTADFVVDPEEFEGRLVGMLNGSQSTS